MICDSNVQFYLKWKQIILICILPYSFDSTEAHWFSKHVLIYIPCEASTCKNEIIIFNPFCLKYLPLITMLSFLRSVCALHYIIYSAMTASFNFSLNVF